MSNTNNNTFIPPDIPVPKHYDELFWGDFLLGVVVGKIVKSQTITIDRIITKETVLEGGNEDGNQV